MAESKRMNTDNTSAGDAVPGRMEQLLCQPCYRKDKQTTADVFCSDCDEFQCNECSKAHTVYAFMKNHKLVHAADVKSKPPSFDMQGMDICEEHGKLLEFFCKDENQLCCSTCAIVDHRKCHDVVEIQKIVAGKSISTGTELKEKLEDAKSIAEKVAKHTQSSKEQLSEDIKAIFGKIKRMRGHVSKMFDDLEVDIANKTDIFQTEVTDKLKKTESICEENKADATKSLGILDNALQNGTPSQQFILEQKMNKQIKELCSNVEEEYQKLESVTISFVFDEMLKLPPSPVSKYMPGQLTLKYFHPVAEENVKVTKDPIFKVTQLASIDLRQTGDDVKEPLYSGLDFLPDGRLVAVDNFNKKCLIYDEKLEKVGSYQLSYAPQTVVVVSEEEVAITSGGAYKIDFLRVSKSNEITLIRTCEVKTKYDSICLKDEGHFVVGTIDDTRPVRIVSLSGEEMDFSISFPNKKYPINTIACTYIRNSNKAVQTDRYEHAVYIYDIATNTRIVVKDAQIREPQSVAVGPSDCVLVCSKITNSLVQISETGRLISSYKLDMEFPRRVCVSKDKTIIAVTNSAIGKRKLQLHKLSDI